MRITSGNTLTKIFFPKIMALFFTETCSQRIKLGVSMGVYLVFCQFKPLCVNGCRGKFDSGPGTIFKFNKNNKLVKLLRNYNQ